MVEPQNIQAIGFHNLKDKDGKIWGFQFAVIETGDKGNWLSQCRFGDAIVDGVRYPKNSLIWNINDTDHTREEMFDLVDEYWQLYDVAYVKVPKPGGLAEGYHDIEIEIGYVTNFLPGQEKEADGSGLGNGFPGFPNPKRRLLLVW
ncbi:MAG: hypothetical protein IT169_06000 [Bryobacterales bacterium]|nr:hypothetical protein [Bryobacterales bacterium]